MSEHSLNEYHIIDIDIGNDRVVTSTEFLDYTVGASSGNDLLIGIRIKKNNVDLDLANLNTTTKAHIIDDSRNVCIGSSEIYGDGISIQDNIVLFTKEYADDVILSGSEKFSMYFNITINSTSSLQKVVVLGMIEGFISNAAMT